MPPKEGNKLPALDRKERSERGGGGRQTDRQTDRQTETERYRDKEEEEEEEDGGGKIQRERAGNDDKN